MKSVLTGLILLIGAVFSAPRAQAHSVAWAVLPEQTATVLQFSYTESEPIAFAEVTVTDPDGRVFQKGHADRLGRFAVVLAEGSGDGWLVEASNGQGHTVSVRLAEKAMDVAQARREFRAQVIGWLAVVLAVSTCVLAARLHEVGGWWGKRRAPL